MADSEVLLSLPGVAGQRRPAAVEVVEWSGPPLNLIDVAPAAGRLFIAMERSVVGLSLATLQSSEVVASDLLVSSHELEVPLPTSAIRLLCSTVCERPVVAVVDSHGLVMVFLADTANGTCPEVLLLRCHGPAFGGLAFAYDTDSGGAFLYVGCAHGQVLRWVLFLSTDGTALTTHAPPDEFGQLRGEVAGDAAVVDIDVHGTRVLAAALDGLLELRGMADASGFGPSLAVSLPADRADCAEVPTLWGCKWIPLSALRGPSSAAVCFAAFRNRASNGRLADWGALPAEIICRCVLRFVSVRDLACCIAPLNRAQLVGVEVELSNRHIALCFSDCTAWLLDEHMRVLTRHHLPFCAAHSQALLLRRQATVLFAPKTDLVAGPGPCIAVMPHLWALTCSLAPAAAADGAGVSRRSALRLQTQIQRIDLRPLESAIVAAADVGAQPSVERPEQRPSPPAPLPPVPRGSAHVLGLAIVGEMEALAWVYLATGELLAHRICIPAPSSLEIDTGVASAPT